jgi:protein-L-isoaspartate(D-aspartate) O-methyltransferase
MSDDVFSELRQVMLAEITAEVVYACGQLGKAALAGRVMEVMGGVPRHDYVPVELRPYAYINSPLPIGFGKSISQPFIVAVMVDLLDVQPTDAVLEIGTGLGYQSAILSRLAKRVYSMELIEELAAQARHRLHRHGHDNVEVRIADGNLGWPEHAPFDKVIVTAAPELIPPALIYQLKPGGKMVIPAGLPEDQKLIVLDKDERGKVTTKEIFAVRFSVLD